MAVVIALICAAVCVWVWWNSRKGGAKAPPAGPSDWTVELKDSESHPITSVYLIRGNKREFFTSVNTRDIDYDDLIFRAQAAAEDEASDRNSTLKALES